MAGSPVFSIGGTIAVRHCAAERAVINLHRSSALVSMGSKRWSRSATDAGMSSYDCRSIADALALAAEVASGKDG